jgi:hypothetical protein
MPPTAAAHRDRSGWLLFFGIVEILIGAVFCLPGVIVLLALPFLSLTQPAAPIPSPAGVLLNLLLYFAGGAAFITLGVGTLRARRWARAIMLILAWPWLLTGVLGLGFLYFLMPVLDEMVSAQSGKSVPFGAWVFMFGLLAAMSVVMPLVFIIFYSDDNVRRTFEVRHAAGSWVDGRPLPILGFAGAMWMYALLILAGVPRGATGVFGFVLTGVPAYVIGTLHALFCVWLGMEVVRMSKAGWWMNVLYAVVLHISGWLTFKYVGMERMLECMGRPELKQTVPPALLETIAGAAWWFAPISLLVWIGSLVWLRRHYPPGTFARPPAPASPGVAPARR